MNIPNSVVLVLAMILIATSDSCGQGLSPSSSDATRKSAVEQRRGDWVKRGVQVDGFAYDVADVDRMAKVVLRGRQWADKGITVSGFAYDETDVDRMGHAAAKRKEWAEKGVPVNEYAYDVADVDRMAAVSVRRDYWARRGIPITAYAYDSNDVDRLAADSEARATQQRSDGLAIPSYGLRQSQTIRSSPSSSSPGTGGYYDYNYRPPVGDHAVRSYLRDDGTYVPRHRRTNADDSFWNNWSSYGNSNPQTGRIGTKVPSHNYGGGPTYVPGYLRSNGTYVGGHYRSK